MPSLTSYLSTGPAQPVRSWPLKIGVKPSAPCLARIALASSAGISRTLMFRQRISLPWVWSWIGPLGGIGLRAVPVVLQDGVVDDELAVEVDRGPGADLDDPERVPLADRLVGQDQRVLAGVAGAVVPEAARALVGAHPGVAGLGVVPDLDLGRAAEVDAAVPLGADLEVDEQLDVAVVLVGGQVDALAVVDDLAVVDAASASSCPRRRGRAAWPSPRRSARRTCAGRPSPGRASR